MENYVDNDFRGNESPHEAECESTYGNHDKDQTIYDDREYDPNEKYGY